MALQTYESIATYTVSSPVTPITFTSIPATFTDLRLVCKVKEASGYADARIQFNGDTATNYNGGRIYASGSSAAGGYSTDVTGIWISQNSDNATDFAQITVDINNYASTTGYKTCLTQQVNARYNNQTPQFLNFTWRSTAAITSMSIFIPTGINWAVGSKFTLFGIKAA